MDSYSGYTGTGISPFELISKLHADSIDFDIGCNCIYNPWGEFRSWFEYGMFIVLVVGLILGSILIYRKHKGEKGLWKRVLKWDLIFILIIIALGFIVGFLVHRIFFSEYMY